MFFIDFPIKSYLSNPTHPTTCPRSGYTKPCPSQANQIYYHSLHRYLSAIQVSNMLPTKKLNESSRTPIPFIVKQQSIATQSSIKSMLSSLQSGRYSFTIKIVLATTRTISTNNPCLYFSQFSSLYFTSLLAHKTIPTIPATTSLLYTSVMFRPPIFTFSHPYNPHQKVLSPASAIQLIQAASRAQ